MPYKPNSFDNWQAFRNQKLAYSSFSGTYVLFCLLVFYFLLTGKTRSCYTLTMCQALVLYSGLTVSIRFMCKGA